MSPTADGDFEQRLHELGQGDHVCMVYDNRAEQMAAAVPFMLHGLSANERCFYIADDQTVDEVLAALAARGIDVAREQDKGSLVLLTKREAYLKGGAFDPHEMVDTLSRSTEDALRAGFSGFRVTGEMTWALGHETGCDRLIEYEALLNRFFPGSRALAICQYNRERFSPSIIRDVLRTHPQAVLGRHVCSNLYYEPPEFLLTGGNDAERVDWMIRQLKRNEGAFVERRRAEEKLREADRKKDVFLATLAHELRNPLAPVRNAVTVLKSKPTADPQERWCRDVIDRQVGQMTHLLEDLLDVSRITLGKLSLRREWIDLAEVVGQAVEAARPLVDAGGHELTVALPDRPVALDADPTRLAQVFSNLLTNAAKYTERGGRIWLTAERQGSDAVVSVRDTGIGIPPDHLPKLFEMFSQVDATLERAQGGLGIGLSLVRGLVEMHGGTVTAESAGLGHGSTFTVRLPLTVDTSKGPPAIQSPIPTVASARRILVADDNRDGADSLALMLEAAGNEVRVAYDGDEAVRLAEAFRPDTVLLDIGMPKLNGYEASRRIRAQPWAAGVTIVAQTGWGQDEDRRRSEEAGFDHHLVKPVDPAALLALLTVPVTRRTAAAVAAG